MFSTPKSINSNNKNTDDLRINLDTLNKPRHTKRSNSKKKELLTIILLSKGNQEIQFQQKIVEMSLLLHHPNLKNID
jgi:hypothetical protein